MNALFATLVLGQLTVIPANETDGAAVVISEQVGMWWIFTGKSDQVTGFVLDILRPTLELEGGKVAVLSGPPGHYVVVQQYEKPDGGWDWFKAVVVIRGPPEPGPGPDPPPPPPPPGKRNVVIIYETENNPPGFGLITQAVQAYCKGKGHGYGRYDKNTVDGTTRQRPEWLQKYLDLIASQNVALPAMLVMTDSHAAVVPMPTTPQAAVAKIKELGG